MIQPFYFEANEQLAVARRYRDTFLSARPFRHVIIDDFLPAWTLETVLEEFPSPGEIPWKEFKQTTARKLASQGDAFFGPFTRHLLQQFNSQPFLLFLEELTGINGLIPDPYYEGGGLHQIEPGGFLKVHADFNFYERLQLNRRLNVLVYLNKDWREEYGGALELWDSAMTSAQVKVFPLFNRCLIFATTDDSFHGHPDPLSCPEDRRRRSMALYYYTADSSAELVTHHNTLYQARPGENIQSGGILRRLATKLRTR